MKQTGARMYAYLGNLLCSLQVLPEPVIAMLLGVFMFRGCVDRGLAEKRGFLRVLDIRAITIQSYIRKSSYENSGPARQDVR
jgi:hypothetical protein